MDRVGEILPLVVQDVQESPDADGRDGHRERKLDDGVVVLRQVDLPGLQETQGIGVEFEHLSSGDQAAARIAQVFVHENPVLRRPREGGKRREDERRGVGPLSLAREPGGGDQRKFFRGDGFVDEVLVNHRSRKRDA